VRDLAAGERIVPVLVGDCLKERAVAADVGETERASRVTG
jgi:hypothetical protein